ncbi:MAG: xanthine dehydrogenase family protein, partial [Actinobacteria bacterium]
MTATAESHVGRSLRRKEDPRMIAGRGRYIDDYSMTGMLHAAIVRSPEAHARITSIDTSAAASREDVVGVFTGEDLAEDFAAPMVMAWSPPGVVIVEYEPKPVVVDPEKALEEGSPLVWEQFGTNKVHEWTISGGDIDAALAEADVVVEQRLVNHRTAGGAIEARGVLAVPRTDSFTLYSSTQIPHIARYLLSLITGIPEDKLRVVAPDVGGGFGSKLQVYPEEALVLVLAKRLEQPVKWIETRSENMTNSHHGRDQINYVTLGAKRDGTLTACRARIIADLGAYQLLLTPFIPELGFPVMGGCYKFPAIDLRFEGVFTNKFCTDAIRGAGRPEGTYWIELTLDKLADELGMDRLELRRKNFIPKDEFPFTTALGITYDSGDYEGTLDKLLERFDLDAFRREQSELRERG